ncbi:Aste57867_1275 [Aphanomyces stellatus]|uniref:Aste57867_1275 protein n=1 Tax=Aphanomyces stellatus TaxID=120398 RepID=A0A485K627_9STRA|nr:hypothetical protein As57867_001274 [Aphanomyces stellatus]VFT78494.1 Aste57867_1275 [Aphanomyces stellatus]
MVPAIWPEAAPLALVWCCYLYMPVVLCLYVRHRHHPLIKYRQPHLIATTGLLCTIYCLGGPLVLIWNATTPAIAYVLVCYVASILAIATTLLSAMVVVLHHKITELLVAPTQFPSNLIPTLTRTRWLLHPTNQMVCVVGLGCVLAVPQVVFLAATVDIVSTTSAHIFTSRLYNLFLLVLLVELLVAAVLAFRLSKQLTPIVDTFHQRVAYRQSFGSSGLFVTLSAVLALPERFLHLDNRLGADYYCRTILHTLAAQCVIVIHLVVPVYHVLKAQSVTRVAVNSIQMPSHLAELHDYLRERDKYAAFLAFCLVACSRDSSATEVLLAWRCIETFKTCRGARPPHPIASGPNGAMLAAELVVVMCFGPSAPLASVALKAEFGSMYMDRWTAWKAKECATAPPVDFFDEFHRALLAHLTTNVLPRFQVHSQSWLTYTQRNRSLRGLEMVQHMSGISSGRKQSTQQQHEYLTSNVATHANEGVMAPLGLRGYTMLSAQPVDNVNGDEIECHRPAAPTCPIGNA